MDLTGPLRQARRVDATPRNCPGCGWLVTEPYQVLSRHATSEGVLVWSRCPCGRLQAHRADALVVRSNGCRRAP
ncbi:hypothetical protein CFP66_33880 [Pseudonocardia sp. MH-G8]|nr:hypothetical protein CFP66_33880 [Pseudonocardia sp. MH-G8]